MSGQSNQTLGQAGSQYLTIQHAFAAASSLVIYEFLITIVDEIKIVWKRPITASAVLLGSVRWSLLVSTILGLTQPTPNNCSLLNYIIWVLILVGFIQTAVFSALRVFAIWNKSYIWSLIVFALSMVSFATYLTIAVVSMYGFVVDPFVGAACISEISVSAETASILLYVSRGSSIVADTIVLVLTWIKTFGHWRDVRRANIGVSLTTCLLRDGTIYFIALLVINIAQPLTYNFSADLSPVGVFVASPVGAFVAVLPPVLINRFMINLRTVESEVPDCSVSVTDWQQGQSTLQFERSMNRLGNIGGPLYDGWSDEPYNDETTFTEVDETGAEV